VQHDCGRFATVELELELELELLQCARSGPAFPAIVKKMQQGCSVGTSALRSGVVVLDHSKLHTQHRRLDV